MKRTGGLSLIFLAGILAAALGGCGNVWEPGWEEAGKDNMADNMTDNNTAGAAGGMTDRITPQLDADGADPWITARGGVYYYTKTTGNNVTLCRSGALTDVAAGESRVIREADSKLENFWAPELHRLDDGWYVYFAANPFDSDIHRMYVLENLNEDPFEGEWTCMEMQGMDDKFAIDGTVLELGEKRFFIWSGWEGYENVRQDIYLAKMASPTEVEPEKILLSKPEYAWEMHGEPLVNEGPQVLVKDDTVNLLYSASGSWTNDYCLGLLTASRDADFADPGVWTKEKEPVFQSANGIFGPGHNGFAKSPDGREDYLIFHSARWDGSGWNRSVRLQKMAFDGNGKILPGLPAPSDELIAMPSGEPKRLRYTEKDFERAGDLSSREEDTVFGAAVTGFLDVSDTLTLRAELPKSGEYTVFVYARIEDCYEDNYRSGLDIGVNGGTTTVQLYPSEYYQPLMLRCSMEKGENIVKVSSEAGGDQISVERIEIMPVSQGGLGE